MRVLLVDPGAVGAGGWGEPLTTKVGLLSLYSYLRERAPGADVAVCDLEMLHEQPEDEPAFEAYRHAVRETLARQPFDLLAISCWSSLKYRASVAVAEIGRALNPGALIVVGGYHPSAMPHDFTYPGSPFDHVIVGEGEAALAALATDGGKGAPAVIEGRWLAAGDEPRLRWDEYPLYRPDEFSFPLFFSRGCPYACGFCMEPFTKGRSWRPLGPEQAMARLDDLLAHRQVLKVEIQDPMFGLRKDWCLPFLGALVGRRGLPLFWAETRSDVMTPEVLSLVGRLDFRLDLGVETASPEMIKVMNKAPSPEQYLRKTAETIRLAGEAGVASMIYLITHYPGERLVHVRETIGFFRDLFQRLETCGVERVLHQKFMYFPGADLDERSLFYRERFGTRIGRPAWWKEPGPLRERSTCVRDDRVSPDQQAEIDAAWKDGLAELNALLPEKLSPRAMIKHGCYQVLRDRRRARAQRL